MKKLFFFVLALCATVLVNAADVTVNLASGTYVDGTITWAEVNGNITIAHNKGNSGTDVNKNNIAAPRMYKGHYLSFVCTDNYTINAVEISYDATTGDYATVYCGSDITAGISVAEKNVVDNTTAIARTLATEAGGKHVFTAATPVKELYIQNSSSTASKYTQLRPTSIKITYTKAAATEPTLAVDAAVDCGKVVDVAAFEPQTLTVVGELLTVAPTYALTTGANFEVKGTLTTAGGDLTITCTATAVGEYTDVLTITSGDLKKEVALSAAIYVATGKGTKEHPFTAADVIALENKLGVDKKYWVQGYILGGASSSGGLSVVKENFQNNGSIVLGDSQDATTGFIPVQLSADPVKTVVGLKDNPTNQGRLIKVCGTLEAYYSAPGVKNVSTAEEFEFLTDESTALENTTAETVKARKIMENGQVYILRDGVRYTILGTLAE